jgi:cytochrome c
MKSDFVSRIAASFLVVLPAIAGHALGAGDAEHGKALYQARCTACHSIEYNGAGPAHKGVFGRKAGSAPGFAYSKALRDSSVVWSEETLAKWLENPEALIPGQRMFVQTPDGAERADLIAYLKRAGG